MRAAFITTVNHNIGDDFVREGLIYLLRKLVPSLQVASVHKHVPVTARTKWTFLHNLGIVGLLDALPIRFGSHLARVIDQLPLSPNSDTILSSDVIVQSGAPVYWLNSSSSCTNTEWFKPLIVRRWRTISSRVPLLNLAGGTCQNYHSDGSEFAGAVDVLQHIRHFFDMCALTTLRDNLSLKILQLAGRSAEVLPCTSIFARSGLGLKPVSAEFIALNYMPAGGHYDFREEINRRRWQETFVTFALDLARREPCILVCHNLSEVAVATRLLPSIPFFFSHDYRSYLSLYSRARYGIVNRVHAAFAIASFGRPSVVIGADTRARMSENIGLRNHFVNETSFDILASEQERLHSTWGDYQIEFQQLRKRAENKYLELLQPVLPGVFDDTKK